MPAVGQVFPLLKQLGLGRYKTPLDKQPGQGKKCQPSITTSMYTACWYMYSMQVAREWRKKSNSHAGFGVTVPILIILLSSHGPTRVRPQLVVSQ